MSYKVIKRTTKWSKDDECIMRHEDILSEFRTLKGAIGFLNRNKDFLEKTLHGCYINESTKRRFVFRNPETDVEIQYYVTSQK